METVEQLLDTIDEETRENLQSCSAEVIFLYLIESYDWELPASLVHWQHSLSTLNNNDIVHLTQFTLSDLKCVTKPLNIPTVFSTPSGCRLAGEEAFFLLLCRLAWPTQLQTLSIFFQYSPSTISKATNWLLTHIHKNWDFLLQDFNSRLAAQHLSPIRLELFASRIYAKGAPLTRCWGFIDCTIREICRPTRWQRECYNGYKHMHAVKYSAVNAPDSIIYHLWGRLEGRRNDNALLSDSQLLIRCKQFAPSFYLFGDPAYPVSTVLLSPLDSSRLTNVEKEFNWKKSSCREVVEWGFADIIRLWSALDFSYTQRIYSVPVGIQYRVATILTNIHIYLYSSETSF